MIRALRFFVLAVGLFVLVVVVLGVFLPRSWEAESTRVLRAPPERVQAALEDLRTWPEWSHWSRTIDNTAQLTFDGPPTGPGARLSWAEGQMLGFGSLTLVAARPGSGGVEYEVQMRGVDELTRGSIVLVPDALGTRATRREGGELGWNPMMRVFAPLFTAKLRRDFDVGFEKLARVVEAPK
jgi:uncharacterized protein YndB with AHSA1/START domain